MDILGNAFESVRRNYVALLIYLVITVGASFTSLFIEYRLFGAPVPQDGSSASDDQTASANEVTESPGEVDRPVPPEPLPERLYRLVSQLLLASLYALASAISFSRIGKDMDRPLWRISGDWEAIERYFVLWLMLQLAGLAILRLFETCAVYASLRALVLFFFAAIFLWFVLVIPVGACIMFGGRMKWSEVSGRLAPLIREMPATLAVFLVTSCSFVTVMLYWKMLANQQDSMAWLWLAPLYDAFLGILDCAAFAATWLICMRHRDAPVDDFDLGI